jgi:class 3 adenylate cyclase/YHS domain-containing protein
MGAAASTFLFADMAGFTALTEAHGDDHAADAAAEFCDRVRELVGPEVTVIKAIGDAVMCSSASAAAAIDAALRITGSFGGEHGALHVRVGMHTGPAVERDGDWYGATVNVAARVAALAAGGEVLLTESTAAAAGELPGVGLRKHGVHELRHVSQPVTVLRALSESGTASAEMDVDPVCHMVVDPGRAAGVLEYRGRAYRFCSLECAGSFARDPERYSS